MRTRSKKLLFLALGVVLALGTLPQTVFALGENPPVVASSEIIAFAPLEDSTASQIVSLGTALENLDFPETLRATVTVEAATEQTDTVQHLGTSAQKKLADADMDTQVGGTVGADSVSGNHVFDPAGGEQPTDTSSEALKSVSDDLFQIPTTTGSAFALGISGADGSPNIPASDHTHSIQQTVSITEFEWVSQPQYDPETIGIYVFSPIFDGQYSLSDSIKLPAITVQVVMGMMSLASTKRIIDLSDSDGDLIIAANNSEGKYSFDNGTKTVTIHSGPITLTGSTTNRHIVVAGMGIVELTLDEVEISLPITIEAHAFAVKSGAEVTLRLVGNNSLISAGFRMTGLSVESGATVTIEGSTADRLNAKGGIDAPGIGANNLTNGGMVIINGGTIDAIGNGSAPAIGACLSNSMEGIIINGGIVHVSSSNMDPVIPVLGGSGYANIPMLTITGGTIDTYGKSIAGITTITITGGSIKTTGISPLLSDGRDTVYLNVLTVGSPPVNAGVAISEMMLDGVSTDYGINDVVTMDGGKVYFFLPRNYTPMASVRLIVDNDLYAHKWARFRPSEAETLFRVTDADTPFIAEQPWNVNYNQGDTATPLTVGASVIDGGALFYQWYQNTTNSTSGSIEVGTNSASYTPSTSEVGTLYYYCVVTNTNIGVSGEQTATTISNIARVNVNELVNAEMPDLTAHPQDRTVNVGDSFGLSVVANVTDHGTLSYQWQMAAGASGGSFEDISGATSADYSSEAAAPGVNRYRVVVTNTNIGVSGEQTATTTSNIARVNVNELVNAEMPDLTAHPQDRTVNVGDSFGLSVVANVTDHGTLSYQWQMAAGTSGGSFEDISGATSADYSSEASAPGVNRYRVVVTNTNGGVNGNITATATSEIASITVNPSDDGSSSNNDDSHGRTPTITILSTNQPDWPTIGSVFGKVSGTNTQRTFTITDSLVKSTLKKAQVEAKAKNRTVYGVGVRITLDTPATSGLTLTLERAALNRLVRVDAKQFEIQGAPIALALDAKALAELQKQSTGNVTLSMVPVTIEGVRNAYDITLSTLKNGKTANITSLGAGFATLSIPSIPGKNETEGYFYAVYVDANGKATRIADSSYDANTGKMMFRTNHFSVYGVGYTAPSSKFTDIEKHWAKDSIDYVVGRGLLSGISETNFAPDTAITREMLVTALGRLANVDTKSYKTNRFIDVNADNAFYPYIEWAYKKSIVQGVGNGKFEPDRAITREEIAVIFSNYAKATGYKLPVTRTVAIFADASSIASTYKTAVTAMQQAGIMMGGTGSKFNPKAMATRAEVFSMLHRYIKLSIDPATAQGWAKNDDGEYLYYKGGKAVTGTQTIDGVKYFFYYSGVLKTGWAKGDSGNWHFYSGNKRLTGWWDINVNGNNKRYYFDTYGNMISDKWIQIDGTWYYFYANGTLAISTKIDEYEVDDNGVRKTK